MLSFAGLKDNMAFYIIFLSYRVTSNQGGDFPLRALE